VELSAYTAEFSETEFTLSNPFTTVNIQVSDFGLLILHNKPVNLNMTISNTIQNKPSTKHDYFHFLSVSLKERGSGWRSETEKTPR